MKGSCKMLIRLWNMQKNSWELLAVQVPGQPEPGPADELLRVKGAYVMPDENGDFISPDYTEMEIDAVHTYAAAKLALKLWEQALEQKIDWSRDSSSEKRHLSLHLAYPVIGALFLPSKKSIYFGQYGPGAKKTWQSFDIVCHEMTHAIIHALHPKVHGSLLFELHAIMEALADLTPIFTLLQIPEINARVFGNSSFDWSKPNLLSEFAEGFGPEEAVGLRSPLRKTHSNETFYDVASKLTSKIYQLLPNLDGDNNNLTCLIKATLDPIMNLGYTDLGSYWKKVLSTHFIDGLQHKKRNDTNQNNG